MWAAGQAGNPDGYSRGRRITDALLKILDDRGLSKDLAMIWLAKARGDHEFLKRAKLKPEWQWFGPLIDRIDGPVPVARDQPAVQASIGSTIDAATAARILEAADPHVVPRLEPGDDDVAAKPADAAAAKPDSKRQPRRPPAPKTGAKKGRSTR